MTRYAVLWAMLFAMPVMADTLALTWVAPTTRADGTVLNATEIAHYRLAWTVKALVQPDKTVTGTSYTLDTVALVGRTCVTLFTVDTDGLESVASNVGCRNARPSPATSLTVK